RLLSERSRELPVAAVPLNQRLCHGCAETDEIAIEKVMGTSLPDHVARAVHLESPKIQKDSAPTWDRQAKTHTSIGKLDTITRCIEVNERGVVKSHRVGFARYRIDERVRA